MAEFCRKCFINSFHPSQYEIEHIVMSEDNDMCESCMSWGPVVMGTDWEAVEWIDQN